MLGCLTVSVQSDVQDDSKKAFFTFTYWGETIFCAHLNPEVRWSANNEHEFRHLSDQNVAVQKRTLKFWVQLSSSILDDNHLTHNKFSCGHAQRMIT